MKLRNKKTGGLANILDDGQEFIRVYTDAGWHDYDSLAELNEEWEDYKPKEPRIKDKKVRKAVRAWAEANDIQGASFYSTSSYWYLRAWSDGEQGIDFWLRWADNPQLIEGRRYTIAELCGEEE